MKLEIIQLFAALLIVMPLFSCAGTRPVNLGVKDGRLSACPSSPNCASSDGADDAHRVAPFQLSVLPADGWRALREILAALPRTKMVTLSGDYLHAECASALFGFVDDLELHLRPAENLIAVRSASRLGHSDFGVNRSRVENLRRLLRERGVVR